MGFDYEICSCVLIIIIVLLFILLFTYRPISRMIAGDLHTDVKKIVRMGGDPHNYPGYVSLIYIHINDTQDCRDYVEDSRGQESDKRKCCALLDRLIETHGNASLSILKPGEVSGNRVDIYDWGDPADCRRSGSVLCPRVFIDLGTPVKRIPPKMRPGIVKDSLSWNLDDCPELERHSELRPLRQYVLNNERNGEVKCIYVYIGECDALGFTEAMFHGLTRDGIKHSKHGNLAVDNSKEFAIGVGLNYNTRKPLNLNMPWPARNNNQSETIVCYGDDGSYYNAFEYVRNQIRNYIAETGSKFSIDDIKRSSTWAAITSLNKDWIERHSAEPDYPCTMPPWFYDFQVPRLCGKLNVPDGRTYLRTLRINTSAERILDGIRPYLNRNAFSILFIDPSLIASAEVMCRAWGWALIHGDMSQDKRQRILESPRLKLIPHVLVITDVAARGINLYKYLPKPWNNADGIRHEPIIDAYEMITPYSQPEVVVRNIFAHAPRGGGTRVLKTHTVVYTEDTSNMAAIRKGLGAC